jgi:plastocyanin
MIRRVIAVAALLVALATALVLATASAQTTWAVKAKDPPDAPTNVWDPGLPDVIEAQPGDTMSFEFDETRTVHNLFLALPDGEELHLSAPPVCAGPLGICSPPPNHPDPIRYTLFEEGEYTYYCTIHGGDADGNGMAGRVVVGDDGGGGGPSPMPNPSEPPAALEDCPGPGNSGCRACLTGRCSGPER